MTTEQPRRMDKGPKSHREIIRMTVKDLNNSDYKLKIGSSLSTVNAWSADDLGVCVGGGTLSLLHSPSRKK